MPHKSPDVTRKYQREWTDRRRRSAGVHKRRSDAEKRAIVNTIKDRPCMDCGGKFPPVAMDFDHRVPAMKTRGGVAGMVARRCKLEEILAEIEKCDLVCANCHRIRTHKTA